MPSQCDHVNEKSVLDYSNDWLSELAGSYVRTPLGEIFVRVGGVQSGPAMVFWSSLMMNSRMWRWQYQHYKTRFRTIFIDGPGFGQSEQLRRLIDIKDCAECLVAIIDQWKIDKFVFVGNAWGGMIASCFAAWYPERLHGAVCINPTASNSTQTETVLWSGVGYLLRNCTQMPGFAVDILAGAFPGATASESKKAFVAFIRATVAELDPKSMGWALHSFAVNRKDMHHLLRTIRNVPVLVIAGDEDPQFPVYTVRKMAKAIDGSKFVVLDETGHLAALESPELVNAEVDYFLKENRICWAES